MEKRMNKEELIELIKNLKIDKDEFWILSSGALVIRGICPDAGDLDIAVTEKGLQQLKENYNLIVRSTGFDYFDGWQAYGVEINWESELSCAHCGEIIESAYGEE